MIIDAWAQHPTLRQSQDPMFDSLRRWTHGSLPAEELPVAATLATMDAGGVDRALISAWVGPRSTMISNDEVASFVEQGGGRLVGVGSVDISGLANLGAFMGRMAARPAVQEAMKAEGLIK